MKRIILSLALLFGCGAGFFALNSIAFRAQQRLRANQSECNAQTQRLAELEAEKTAWAAKLRELRRGLPAHEPAPNSELAGLLSTNAPPSLSPEAWERLRSELGLNWHSSDDWVLLSKATLATVDLTAVKGTNLTEAVCGTLAITPDERRRLNDAFAGTREDFATWAKTSLQREGTNGETLVRFTIPPNPELAAGLSNELTAAVTSTLGEQRAELLHRYARDWYQIEVGGFATMTNTLTVSRRLNGDGPPVLRYDFSVKGGPGQGSRGQSGQIFPNSRYFPNAFQSVFPGGWRELAERGGFELPN